MEDGSKSSKGVCQRKGEYKDGCECLSRCAMKYLDPKSPGTKAHCKTLKNKTTFRGCEPLEAELIEDGFICYSTAESLDTKIELFEELSGDNSVDYHQFVEFENRPFFISITDEELSEYKIFPESYEHLELRAIEWWILEDKCRDKHENRRSSRRFGELMQKILTAKQREAVEAYWINNDDGLSMKAVAAKLKISLDSLRDRLDAAKKKIKEHYSEKLID